MKIVKLVVSLAGSLVVASQLSAQATPDITSVPFRVSYAPNNLIVRGVSLGLVTNVKLNGNTIPIINSNPAGTQLVAGPLTPQQPGFGTVMVSNAGGGDSHPIEFVPSLKAVKRFNRMDLTIRGGAAGTFVIQASYTPRVSGVTQAGTFNERWLTSNSNIVATGVFASDAAVSINNVLFPYQLNMIGMPLHLQGTCVLGADRAFTNRTTLPSL